jgi:hypothetical protein
MQRERVRVYVQLMLRGWEAVPIHEDQGSRLETREERLCAVCKIFGMTLLGLGIGCSFVFVKWAFAIET